MDIKEAIAKRHSVRSYDVSRRVSAEQVEAIRRCCDIADNPFGGGYAIGMISDDGAGDFRPSTYGVIRGASTYLVMALRDDQQARLAGGYAFERVVLEATRLGLGTCWIGGTFRGSRFEAAFPPGGNPDMSIAIVSPLGYAAERQSFLHKLASTIAGSRGRKPFEQLFFESDVSHPLAFESPYAAALESMRLAPSSVNSQPWRAVVCGDRVDFFATRHDRLNEIDMGIALCHFHLGLDESQKKRGHFVVASSPCDYDVPSKWRYVVSFQ